MTEPGRRFTPAKLALLMAIAATGVALVALIGWRQGFDTLAHAVVSGLLAVALLVGSVLMVARDSLHTGDQVFAIRPVLYDGGRRAFPAGTPAVVKRHVRGGLIQLTMGRDADRSEVVLVETALVERIRLRRWRERLCERVLGHRIDADLSATFGWPVCIRCDPIHSRSWHSLPARRSTATGRIGRSQPGQRISFLPPNVADHPADGTPRKDCTR